MVSWRKTTQCAFTSIVYARKAHYASLPILELTIPRMSCHAAPPCQQHKDVKDPQGANLHIDAVSRLSSMSFVGAKHHGRSKPSHS